VPERPQGPVIASTDYMKLFAEQIRQWVPSKEFKVLGTDGFGRSDSRKNCVTSSKSTVISWCWQPWKPG
jgi:pyruvate dehydrogenase complex dehydrogenase (E1) component